MVERFVLDTSVIIEYIVLRSRYRAKVAELFNLASTNTVELYITLVTISEVLYIASRIYQMAGVQDPNGEATDFIEWVSKRTNIIMLNRKMALRAGELKKRLRIAMPGCYVIAAAEATKATPLFKAVEKEMKPVLNELRKLGVKFLREIKF